jgi:hypothetical protein
MNENALRWRGRIGALRSGALALAFLIALGLFFVVVGPLPSARRNAGGPVEVSPSDLVSKTVGVDHYVTFSGTAIYGAGITESDDNGKLVGFVFPVANWDEGALVYVRSAQPSVDAPKDDNEDITVTGMVGNTPTSVKALIQKDLADIAEAGLTTAPEVLVKQGMEPGNAAGLTALAVILGVLIALCLATLAFPQTVFVKRPVEPSTAPAELDRGVRATGRFQRLKSIDPTIVEGKGSRRFRGVVANVIKLDDGRLLIYVRHVVKNQTGATLATSHWGRFPEPRRSTLVEPGKVYGWKDRPAVRIGAKDAKGRADDLLLAFNHGAAQAEFVSYLKEQGFPVVSGV